MMLPMLALACGTWQSDVCVDILFVMKLCGHPERLFSITSIVFEDHAGKDN